MAKKEPLYPHVPRKKPRYPHRTPWEWSAGERAIFQEDDDDLSNVYVVEITKDIRPNTDIVIPVLLKDVLATTTGPPWKIKLVTAEELYRDFERFTEGQPERLEWLESRGIDPEATPYHYRPWEAGDIAFHINYAKDLICGVEIQSVNVMAEVEVVEVYSGDARVGEQLIVPESSLYESFRHYGVLNPDDEIEWAIARMGKALGRDGNTSGA